MKGRDALRDRAPGGAGGGRPHRPGAASRAAAAAVLGAILAAAPLAAQEETWTLAGILTARGFGAGAEGTDASWGSAASLEATLSARGSVLRAEFSLEASLLSGAAARAFAAAVVNPLVAFPADILYAPAAPGSLAAAETVLAARVRTAYVKWNAEAFSLTTGRQVVNYGKGTAWSPVDIFTERDFSGLSVVRRGSDAVRLTVPLGDLSLAEAVAAPAYDLSEGSYALRLAGFAFEALDGSLLAAWDGGREVWIAGADAKADLSFASLYADAAWDLPLDGGGAALRALAGFDASFGDFVLACEYYYNGGGQEADPLFPGAHNLYAALSWEAADYHTLAFSGLADLEEGIISLQAAWAWDLAQNGILTTYLKSANGSSPAQTRSWSVQAGFQVEVRF